MPKEPLDRSAARGTDFHSETDAASLDTPRAGELDELDALPPPPALSRRAAERDASVAYPTVIGDYELIEEIDRGGMGIVFKARQISLDRSVAVKMIRGGLLAREEDLIRFRSEAQSAARLQHPHIVAIHEVGEHQGQPYFSMEFVDGETLAEFAGRNPLSTRESARIVQQIAEAVQAAHDQGILHRDLKPTNVLIDRQNVPRVTDFGLAKQLQSGSGVTASEQVLGTPSYMPPEQAAGHGNRVGFTSDVYALGAILYELLCGRPPFRGESTVATIRQVIDSEPISPRRLNPATSRDLETICLRCLEKDPARRYQSARELSEELSRLLRGEPIHARPLGLAARAGRWCRRNPAAAVALALLMLLAIGGPSVALYTAGLLHRAKVAEADRIAARIHALRTAEPEAVESIVSDLHREREVLQPRLAALWDDASITNGERTRLGIALLRPDSAQFEYTSQRLLDAEAREFDMLRHALQPYCAAIVERLWSELESSSDPRRSLNAAAALASYDPQSDRWTQHAGPVANRLVRQNALTAAAWARFFVPVKAQLIPHLCTVFRDADPSRAAQRTLATDLLSNYAADDAELLVELVTSADARQFASVFEPLKSHGPLANQLLMDKFDEWFAKVSKGDDVSREQVLANLAIARLQLGEREQFWPLLAHAPDPTLRTHLIHRLVPYGVEPTLLARRLAIERDVSVRRAIILALGEASAAQLPPVLLDQLIVDLEQLYRSDPDTGIHAAAEWTLRQWGKEERLQSALASSLDGDPASPLGRFVTCEGQVMRVVRGPIEFRSHGKTVRIDRSFAFAIKEVTREEYLRFEADPRIQAELEAQRVATKSPGAHWHNESWSQSFGPDPKCPHLSPPWVVAARYCRWLGEKEGLPPEESCFVPLPTIDGPAQLAEDYLDRTGYRMPTGAEWEYMCRAGAETERYFGRSVPLLQEYAWYVPNAEERTWPVGMLKPNDFGLFDMHGNIREWTMNRKSRRLKPDENGIAWDDEEPNLKIDILNVMLTCGGAYSSHPRFLRASSLEHGTEAWAGNNVNGMRLARTIHFDD